MNYKLFFLLSELNFPKKCHVKLVRTWRGSSFLLLQSQILTELSVDPDNITEESSLYFTQFTVPACPLYFRSILPVPTSVAHTYLSIPQEHIWLLSQEAWASRTS